MSLATTLPARGALLRHSRWDALLIALAAGHGTLLLAWPAAPVVALGLWWNSNTIAHYFLHAPFFRWRRLNVLFALYESALLGVPQTLWRDWHLAHHAGVAWRLRLTPQLVTEMALVLLVWLVLLTQSPRFFLGGYVPGYLAGLALCYLHGHYEHARGTTSHYGTLYNLLFFNDGYHVEHHAAPGLHWTRLPARIDPEATASRWPAVLRWLDAFSLEGLERLVLRSEALQGFLLDRHERAFRRLLPHLPEARRIAVVGGGLFPRTLLILRRLLPDAELLVIDRSAANIETAQHFLNASGNVTERPPGSCAFAASDGLQDGLGQERPRKHGTHAGAGGRGEELAHSTTGCHAFAAQEDVCHKQHQDGPRKHSGPAPGTPAGAIRFHHGAYRPEEVAGYDVATFPLAFVGDREMIYRLPPARAVFVHDWLWRRRGTGVVVSWLLLKRLNLVTR